MLLITGIELLLQGLPFGLFGLLLMHARLALLKNRLRLLSRLSLKLRAITPSLHLPDQCQQQADADQAARP